MKRLFIIILSVFAIQAQAQVPQVQSSWYLYKEGGYISRMQIPKDTIQPRTGYGDSVYLAAKGDTLYLWSRVQKKFIVSSGGGADSSIYATKYFIGQTYTPLSRTITINGTTYDLSANRSWTIPLADSALYATRYWSGTQYALLIHLHDDRYPQMSGSYSNPSWITSLAYSKLSGVPTEFVPSAASSYYIQNQYTAQQNANLYIKRARFTGLVTIDSMLQLPTWTTNPTGISNGAIGYNLTDNKGKIYENGTFRNILTDASGSNGITTTSVGDVKLGGTLTANTAITIPTTFADGTGIDFVGQNGGSFSIRKVGTNVRIDGSKGFGFFSNYQPADGAAFFSVGAGSVLGRLAYYFQAGSFSVYGDGGVRTKRIWLQDGDGVSSSGYNLDSVRNAILSPNDGMPAASSDSKSVLLRIGRGKTGGLNYNYIDIGTDSTSNSGWLQSRKNGISMFSTLSLNPLGGKVSVGSTSSGIYFNIRGTYTPSSSTDSNGSTGDLSWDDNYIYIRTSTGWKRSALTTF